MVKFRQNPKTAQWGRPVAGALLGSPQWWGWGRCRELFPMERESELGLIGDWAAGCEDGC